LLLLLLLEGGAKVSVFGERGDGGEWVLAPVALDLHATVDVHALVATQVGELRVGLAADFATEWFDT